MMRYARSETRWTIGLAQTWAFDALSDAIDADGVVTQYGFEKPIRATSGQSIATVLGSAETPNIDVPRVINDDHLSGRMIAQHFVDRGFTRLAFFGRPGEVYSDRRCKGFVEAAKELGCSEVKICGLGDAASSNEREQFIAWLQTLPTPTAIMASDDSLALGVTQTAHAMGIDVPTQIAICGVDNDELLCGISSVPVSSLELATERIGYESAALLHRLMQGQAPPSEPLVIPPVRIVTRQSTDVLEIQDEDVGAAVRYIDANIAEIQGVQDVVEAVSVSRRALERRFRSHLGRSLLQEILRVRMNRSRQLLRDTNLTMPEIAQRAGFSSAVHLSKSFSRETGESPTAYRARVRMG